MRKTQTKERIHQNKNDYPCNAWTVIEPRLVERWLRENEEQERLAERLERLEFDRDHVEPHLKDAQKNE